jgi:hypothetical protein
MKLELIGSPLPAVRRGTWVNVCGVAAGILIFADASCFDG